MDKPNKETRDRLSHIASAIQLNAMKEADAIVQYQNLINDLRWFENNENKDIAETAENLIEMIEELISDELNHQEKLHDTYILLTSIKAAKD